METNLPGQSQHLLSRKPVPPPTTIEDIREEKPHVQVEPRASQRPSGTLRLWIFEILSLLLALAALAAIVITLELHHDRPLPRWPSLISINSLISIFTTILKACLLLPVTESMQGYETSLTRLTPCPQVLGSSNGIGSVPTDP